MSDEPSHTRRRLLKFGAVAPLLALAPLARFAEAGTAQMAAPSRAAGGSAVTGSSSTEPMIFDALGEIRTVYTMNLVDQILASGTRAISITLTDPKVDQADAFDLMMKDLADYNLYFRKHQSHYRVARNVMDIEVARRENKLAIFYNLQNSTPIDKDLSRVALLKSLGLTAVQLTYNDQNHSGAGCFAKGDTGLTPFGRQLLDQMASDRMLVDLSHAGMKTMADAIAASPRPVIISHTACRALRKHPRNTTDENIRALADRGGVMGMAQMRTFMTDAKTDNLDVYFDHIEHAVKVAGVDHVGIGSDRDHRVIPDTEEEIAILLKEEGAQFKPSDWPLYLEKLNGPRRMEVVREGLKKRKLPQSAIDKILGMNVHRLYQSVVG